MNAIQPIRAASASKPRKSAASRRNITARDRQASKASQTKVASLATCRKSSHANHRRSPHSVAKNVAYKSPQGIVKKTLSSPNKSRKLSQKLSLSVCVSQLTFSCSCCCRSQNLEASKRPCHVHRTTSRSPNKDGRRRARLCINSTLSQIYSLPCFLARRHYHFPTA